MRSELKLEGHNKLLITPAGLIENACSVRVALRTDYLQSRTKRLRYGGRNEQAATVQGAIAPTTTGGSMSGGDPEVIKGFIGGDPGFVDWDLVSGDTGI